MNAYGYKFSVSISPVGQSWVNYIHYYSCILPLFCVARIARKSQSETKRGNKILEHRNRQTDEVPCNNDTYLSSLHGEKYTQGVKSTHKFDFLQFTFSRAARNVFPILISSWNCSLNVNKKKVNWQNNKMWLRQVKGFLFHWNTRFNSSGVS